MDNDKQVIMVGASFEEIDAAVTAAVKKQIDIQVKSVTPTITKTLIEGAAALNQANTLIKRYRIALSIAAFLLGLESVVLAILLLHR